MVRRLRDVEDVQDGGGRADGVAELAAADLLAGLADGVEQLVVVGDGARGPGHRASGPVGAERSGCDRGDVNAEAGDLLGQGRENAFESELAAAVARDPGEAGE